MKTRLLWFAIFFFVILFAFESAKACSCSGRQTPAKAFVEADEILIGTISKLEVVQDNQGYRDLRATFLVDEVLKGKKGEKINIFTSSQGTACGYPFEDG